MSALTFKDLSSELTQAVETQLLAPLGTQARCTLGREKVMVLVEYPLDSAQAEPQANTTLDWLEQSLRQQFDTVGLPEEAAELAETGEAVTVQLFLKHTSESKPFTARSFDWKVADGFDDLFGTPPPDSAAEDRGTEDRNFEGRNFEGRNADNTDLEASDAENRTLQNSSFQDTTGSLASLSTELNASDEPDASEASNVADTPFNVPPSGDAPDRMDTFPSIDLLLEEEEDTIPSELDDDYLEPESDLDDELDLDDGFSPIEVVDVIPTQIETAVSEKAFSNEALDAALDDGTLDDEALDDEALDDEALDDEASDGETLDGEIETEIAQSELLEEELLEDESLEIESLEIESSDPFSLPGDEPVLDSSDLNLPTVDLPIARSQDNAADDGFFDLEMDSSSKPSNPSDSELAADLENALDRSIAEQKAADVESANAVEEIFSELIEDSGEATAPAPAAQINALSENVLSENALAEIEARSRRTATDAHSTETLENRGTVRPNTDAFYSYEAREGDLDGAEFNLSSLNDTKPGADIFDSDEDEFDFDLVLDRAVSQIVDVDTLDEPVLAPDADETSEAYPEEAPENRSADDLAVETTKDLAAEEQADEQETAEQNEAAVGFDEYSSNEYGSNEYGSDKYGPDEQPGEEGTATPAARYVEDEPSENDLSGDSPYQLASEPEEDIPYEDVGLIDEQEVQQQREQWEQQTKGNPWIFAGAIGFIVIGILGFVFTRPCSFGPCPRIATAQAEGEKALSDLTLGADLSAVNTSKQQLKSSVQALQPIPVWSPHYQEAKAVLPQFESQLSALDRVSAAQGQAYEAAVDSQDPPHSAADWEKIAQKWRGAIALLENVPTENPVRRLADRKLTEYRANLSTIKVRIDAEAQAEARMLEAQQAATLATAAAKQANSLEAWESTLDNWQTAVNSLNQIPQGTLAYAEAQGLLAEYRAQMEVVRDRTLQERNASRGLSKAQELAFDAERVETEDQWTVAVQTWKAAVREVKALTVGTAAHQAAQPLIGLYEQSLAKAETNRQVSQRFQPVEPSFYAACGATAAQKCTYSVRGGNVRLDLFQGYDSAINQSITPPDQRTEITLANNIVTQSNQLLKEITLLSTQAQVPIELYDAKGDFLARYRPDLNGFVKDQETQVSLTSG